VIWDGDTVSKLDDVKAAWYAIEVKRPSYTFAHLIFGSMNLFQILMPRMKKMKTRTKIWTRMKTRNDREKDED
jgi:hypothetical protein